VVIKPRDQFTFTLPLWVPAVPVEVLNLCSPGLHLMGFEPFERKLIQIGYTGNGPNLCCVVKPETEHVGAFTLAMCLNYFNYDLFYFSLPCDGPISCTVSESTVGRFIISDKF
jgi:hypothetical protein